jgi:hypothetical protein
MSPAEEIDGDITRNFLSLKSRPCDEIRAVMGGSGYHGSIRGVLGVVLLQVSRAWNIEIFHPK